MTSTFVAEPGESLMAALPPFEAADRFARFLELTGLGADQVVTSALCAMPLPRYRTHVPLARQAHVAPNVLGCPLFWLPPKSAGRYRIANPDGTTRVETDDEWAVRVCIELSLAGLYDETTGTWVDVLAEMGLDPTNPEHQARIANWRSGVNDIALDGIDLSERMDIDPENPRWSIETAFEAMDSLRITSWAVTSDSLLGIVCDMQDGTQEYSDSLLSTVAEIALMLFMGIEDHPHVALWESIATTPSRNSLASAEEALLDVRDTYWPLFEKLAAEDITQDDSWGSWA